MGRFNMPRGGKFGNRGGKRREMFRAKCDQCGDSCEVPFKPTGSKPVLCSDCFGGNDDRRGRGRDRGGFGGRRNDRREERQMYDAICDECNNSCEVPFRPSNDKPVLCSECFGKSDRGSKGRRNQSGENQAEIIAKLDKIIELMEASLPTKKVTKKAAKEKVKPVETEAIEEDVVKEEKAKKKASKKVATKKATTKKETKKKETKTKKTKKK